MIHSVTWVVLPTSDSFHCSSLSSQDGCRADSVTGQCATPTVPQGRANVQQLATSEQLDGETGDRSISGTEYICRECEDEPEDAK